MHRTGVHMCMHMLYMCVCRGTPVPGSRAAARQGAAREGRLGRSAVVRSRGGSAEATDGLAAMSRSAESSSCELTTHALYARLVRVRVRVSYA